MAQRRPAQPDHLPADYPRAYRSAVGPFGKAMVAISLLPSSAIRLLASPGVPQMLPSGVQRL